MAGSDVLDAAATPATPRAEDTNKDSYSVRVKGPGEKVLLDETLNLAPSQPANLTVHAEKEGLYSVLVLDHLGHEIAERNIDLVDRLQEMLDTARDMESLRQWAAISGGKAYPIEEVQDASEIAQAIQHASLETMTGQLVRLPIGLNGWSMLVIVGCLGTEWFLRKRWNLR